MLTGVSVKCENHFVDECSCCELVCGTVEGDLNTRILEVDGNLDTQNPKTKLTNTEDCLRRG